MFNVAELMIFMQIGNHNNDNNGNSVRYEDLGEDEKDDYAMNATCLESTIQVRSCLGFKALINLTSKFSEKQFKKIRYIYI